MKFFTYKIRNAFFKDDAGAVTVDWVVLTSAVIGISIAVVTTIAQGSKTYAHKINTEIEQITLD